MLPINVNDYAEASGRKVPDINNALNRLVAPELVPPTSWGQTRYLKPETAALAELSILARAAGFSPEAVQVLTRKLAGKLYPSNAAFAVIWGDCDLVHLITADELQQTASDLTEGPSDRVMFLGVSRIRKIVDAAIAIAAKRFDLDPAQFTERPTPAEFKAKRDLARIADQKRDGAAAGQKKRRASKKKERA